MEHVVKTTVFISDFKDFEEMNKVYARLFPTNQPARCTVQVVLYDGFKVEIEAIAIITSQSVYESFCACVLNRRHDLVSRHSCSSCKCISGPLSIRRTKVQGEVTFFETVVIGLSATITPNDNWDDLNRKSHWVSCFTTHSDLLLPP